jgi:hypothetical protein
LPSEVNGGGYCPSLPKFPWNYPALVVAALEKRRKAYECLGVVLRARDFEPWGNDSRKTRLYA